MSVVLHLVRGAPRRLLGKQSTQLRLNIMWCVCSIDEHKVEGNFEHVMCHCPRWKEARDTVVAKHGRTDCFTNVSATAVKCAMSRVSRAAIEWVQRERPAVALQPPACIDAQF